MLDYLNLFMGMQLRQTRNCENSVAYFMFRIKHCNFNTHNKIHSTGSNCYIFSLLNELHIPTVYEMLKFRLAQPLEQERINEVFRKSFLFILT